MGAVILIEDDKKIRFQIQQMVKEIADDCQLAMFDTSLDFENVFCPADAFDKPMESNPLLQELNEDERTYLLQNEMSKVELPGKLSFHFDPAMDVIQSISGASDGKVFGFDRSTLVGERLAFPNLIPLVFRKRWEAATTAVKPGMAVHLRLPVLDFDRRYYFLDLVLGIDQKRQPVLEITDINIKIGESLVKERQRMVRLSEQDKDIKPFSTIDLIIFRTNCVEKPPLPWVDKIFRNCKALNYFPEDSQTRFVVLKYEDDGIDKLAFVHPRIDDVIHLPLDRVLFLQKIDIMLNLPQKASPRFLFQQAVEVPIEISKRVLLQQLSDVGLVMTNPVPLKEGTLANFYITLPKQTEIINVFAKVLKNEKRRELPGYLVSFGYVGITKAMTSQIRRHLGQTKGYTPLVNDQAIHFQFNPNDLFLTEEDRRIRQFLVLDVDDQHLDNTTSLIEQHMQQVETITETSYARLLETHLGQNSAKHALRLKTSMPAAAMDFPAEVFAMTLNKENRLVQNILNPFKADTLLLGHPIHEWIGKDAYLEQMFSEKDLREIFEEALLLATPKKRVERLFLAHNAKREIRAISIKISVFDAETLLLEFAAPTPEMLQRRMKNEKALEKLDALIIDSAFVPEHVEGFVNGLEAAVKRKGLLAAGKNLNIIVLVDEAHLAHLNMKRFEHPAIRAILIKPLDGRGLAFALSFWADAPYTLFRSNNIMWSQADFVIHMATDIVVEEISEFGATLRHPRPIAPGAVLFLRKSIYDQAPGTCLSARFYRCEEHPTKKGNFQCAVTYFGINDSFMKWARNYFRETYAQAKAKEASN